MKPLEAREYMLYACKILSEGQPLPPHIRFWLVGALRRRLASPSASLDRLLSLKSRSAGRLHAFSTNPDRDRAIRALAGENGLVSDRVRHLLERIKLHRVCPDTQLQRLEADFGRIPGSASQLQRILSRRTVASTIADGHLND